MTRKNDDKRGNNEFGDEPDAGYNAKVEARFTKEATAKSGQDGKIVGHKMGESHATDGKPRQSP